MQRNNKNFILFLVLTFGLLFGWIQVQNWLWPPAKKQPAEKPDVVKAEPKPKDPPPQKPVEKETGFDLAPWAGQVVARAALEAVRPRPARRFLVLGDDKNSNLRIVFDSRGGCIRSVVLNKFQQADANGRPVWDDEAKKKPKPLELVMEELNRESGSNLLFHLDPERKGYDPLPTLGEADWDVVEFSNEAATGIPRAVFRIEAIDGIRITKTYTLDPKDYHVGLEVKLERVEPSDKAKPFSYQITSAHGLRTEGEWYATVLRNALIGWKDTKKDSFLRSLDEARRVSFRNGGDVVEARERDKQLRYAGVAVQFFASLIVVDDQQENQDFILRARSTLEGAAMKGLVKTADRAAGSFILIGADKAEYPFHLAPGTVWPLGPVEPVPGRRLAVVFTVDANDRRLATEFRSEEQTEPSFFNDIMVRMTTEPIDLKVGVPVVHKYLLYNGPVKVRLLGQLEGDKAVSPDKAYTQELVDRYEHTLHLNTLTDYPSSGVSEWLNSVGWTWLLVKCTNLMHSVLWLLHNFLMPWSWGLCIIMLTVLVRGMMFPISRKQAMTSIRMQELAPELKKLQEKHKNDRQAMGVAQMELYRKHGVNPLGTCWLLFLQMPVFLGLYYALQESIHFRLAPFWPWIENLAAPDMLLFWTDRIPWLSVPADYGGFIYLGPYFNLLPVIAVALMIAQAEL